MDDEARVRLKKAAKALEAARILYENELYEDCISRAYYAMHHAARAALALEESSPKTHSGLVNQFGDKIVRLGKMDARQAKELRDGLEMRIKSDYSADFEVNKQRVREILSNTEDFVSSVTKYVKQRLVAKHK